MWNWEQLSQHPLFPFAMHAGAKVLVALALWLLGRWLINNVALKLLGRALNVRKFDPTLTRYALSIVHITLNIVLVIGILGYFGIETTSFAAIIAAAG